MRTPFVLHLRRFPVELKDNRTGAELADAVTLDKSQLQAAQVCGQSSKELIERICARQGFTVLDIGRPERRALALDLDRLLDGLDEEAADENEAP